MNNIIIPKQVLTIKVNRFTKKHYINQGFNCKVDDRLEIKPTNLAKGSHEKILVQCPRCNNIRKTQYRYIFKYKTTLCNGCSNSGSLQSFIKKANKVHNNKYDYSKSKYKNVKTKIIITCPTHGDFIQTPNDHLSGYGCLPCSPTSQKTLDVFIKESRVVHGDRYDYSKVKYKNLVTKVIIICPEHGEFKQYPASHIHHKTGCPDCNMSKGEVAIYVLLTNNGINFETQWVDHNAKGMKGGKLKFDFYLPNYNTCIEFDGGGHFRPIDYFGGEKALKRTQQHDQIKNQWAKENNYKLIRIPYWDFDNIEAILTKELNL